MDLTLIEWLSTFFFLIGAYYYSGNKASDPKTRIRAFVFYNIGGIIFITLNLYYQSYPFATTQIIFTILDVRGIINCKKEIKNERTKFN